MRCLKDRDPARGDIRWQRDGVSGGGCGPAPPRASPGSATQEARPPRRPLHRLPHARIAPARAASLLVSESAARPLNTAPRPWRVPDAFPNRKPAPAVPPGSADPALPRRTTARWTRAAPGQCGQKLLPRSFSIPHRRIGALDPVIAGRGLPGPSHKKERRARALLENPADRARGPAQKYRGPIQSPRFSDKRSRGPCESRPGVGLPGWPPETAGWHPNISFLEATRRLFRDVFFPVRSFGLDRWRDPVFARVTPNTQAPAAKDISLSAPDVQERAAKPAAALRRARQKQPSGPALSRAAAGAGGPSAFPQRVNHNIFQVQAQEAQRNILLIIR